MIKTRQEAILWCLKHLQHHLLHTATDHEPRPFIQVDPAELTQLLSYLSIEQFSRGDTYENNPPS
jgi:hypothetical protein